MRCTNCGCAPARTAILYTLLNWHIMTIMFDSTNSSTKLRTNTLYQDSHRPADPPVGPIQLLVFANAFFVWVSNPAHMIAHETTPTADSRNHSCQLSNTNPQAPSSPHPPLFLPPSPALHRPALPHGCAGVNGGRERSGHGVRRGWHHESLGGRLEASDRHCGSGSHGRPFPPAADARLLETNGRHGFLSLRGCL